MHVIHDDARNAVQHFIAHLSTNPLMMPAIQQIEAASLDHEVDLDPQLECPALLHWPTRIGAGLLLMQIIDVLRHNLEWSSHYERSPLTESFIDGLALAQIVGPRGLLHSEDVIVGIFCFAPGFEYPEHGHAAEEVYLLLSGDADFRQGANGSWNQISPRDMVLHTSNQPHGIRTFRLPAVGLYSWYGDIHSPTWFLKADDEGRPQRVTV